MQHIAELKQNINFKRRHLRHHLRRVHELLFAHFLIAMAVGHIQINALRQLHIIQQRVEGDEVGKANFVSGLTAAGRLRTKKLNKPRAIKYVRHTRIQFWRRPNAIFRNRSRVSEKISVPQ